jgi:hypothetical protein
MIDSPLFFLGVFRQCSRRWADAMSLRALDYG